MSKPGLAIAIGVPKDGDEGEKDGKDGGMDEVGELCLPQDTVATANERDEKVAPEVGDEVRFDCVAKVTKVEGGNVYVSPTEVNGQPVGDENEEPDKGPDADNEDSMRNMAQSADTAASAQGGY
jgi:hypothetical protein